jgi:predicted HicB family RNase H-like nuclease
MVREANPDRYAKALTLKVSEEEHRKLKSMAAEQGLTIKEAILSALDKMFPGWREGNK